jgi:SAM-dependent methyltransferase
MKSIDNKYKFNGRAEGYSKHRPGYADGFVDYLIENNFLTQNGLIADIGSGTGILSRQLLEKGLKVIAVEPNDDMRKEAENSLASFPKFISINGTAEFTGINEKSIDLVTAAQAFHWFDKEKFKAECKRILKTGSKVSLVWNSRVADDPMVIECGKIFMDMCPIFKGFSGGIDDSPDVFDSFFKEGRFDSRVFLNDLKYDLEGFIGRNLSASYAPLDGDPGFKGFIDALSRIFEKYSKDGYIIMPNVTRSYIGEV